MSQVKKFHVFILMAKVLFGQGVADIRGKIAGSVFSRNRSGAYIRTKVTPVNPSSTFQSQARNRLASFSAAWRGLTEAQRNAWNAAVDQFTGTDVFGNSETPSGKNLYTKLNINLDLISGSALTDPPTPAEVPGVTTLTPTAAKGTPALSLAFTPSTSPASTDLLVYATAGQSPGVSFSSSQLRLIGVISGGASSPYDALSDYTDRFGVIPPAGQKIIVNLVPVENTTGQAGIGLKASCIVAA